MVDYTGVGRPVFDLFAESRVLRSAEGVVITSGRDVNTIPQGYTVPKMELVSKLQAALHSGDLKIAKGIADAPVLLRELQDFRVRYTEAGNATFNAREGAHDDLVLALAMAMFVLTQQDYTTELEVRWGR